MPSEQSLTTISIRKAQAKDACALAQILLACRRLTFTWRDPSHFHLEDFEQQTQGEVVFLAENPQGVILGFISLWEADSFIHHLYISPDHQRSGIGRCLIESLFSWLPFPYRLKCLAKNHQALEFYTNHNWTAIEEGTSDEGDYFLLELAEPFS